MLARNHEVSAFATVCLSAALVGVPPLGSVILGLLGGWAGDWPDIDHHGATATKSLRWIPYGIDFPRDKSGDHVRRKDGRIRWKFRWFPSLPVHHFFCWISAALWERFATPADRADRAGSWGPAFRVHRGFTHSIWCALATGLVWWAILAPWPIWSPLAPVFGAVDVPTLIGCTVALGMVAHVAGDGCTDFGVSPFAPVVKWRGRRYPRLALLPEPLRFKVDKSVEKIIITPLVGLLAVYATAAAFFGPQVVLDALWNLGTGLWSQLA